MTKEKEVIRTDCRTCKAVTRNEVLFEHVEETGPGGYHERDTWQIVRCLGCHTTGFRHRNDDYEQVWEDSEGQVRHTVRTTVYPRVVRNHSGLKGTIWIPELIRNVYRQTLSAHSETSYVLASIGLRATIEAVCNHLNISGSSLEKRIDQLYKSGFVSNSDKKRLHAIRFLGNDAAHQVKEPKESDLRVALEIVEHILNSVFILERKSKSLETIIESYEEFLRVIESCILSTDATQAASLGAILGTKRRLVGNNLDNFETQLKASIEAGTTKYLTLAQVENSGGKELQLYSIGDISELSKSKENDENFPF
jgi:hypothetical protein